MKYVCRFFQRINIFRGGKWKAFLNTSPLHLVNKISLRLFPKCHLLSQQSSSHTYGTQRRHVRRRSHDPTRLPIIFWFPHTCHLSMRLEPSAGRAMRPDWGRQKGISHRRFAAVSPSLWCHGADVSRAWFFSLQPGQDKEHQTSRLIPPRARQRGNEAGSLDNGLHRITTRSARKSAAWCHRFEFLFRVRASRFGIYETDKQTQQLGEGATRN